MFHACCGVSCAGAGATSVNLWSSSLEVGLCAVSSGLRCSVCVVAASGVSNTILAYASLVVKFVFLRRKQVWRGMLGHSSPGNMAVQCKLSKLKILSCCAEPYYLEVLCNKRLSMRRTAPKKAATASSTGCLPSSATGTSSSASTTWNSATMALLIIDLSSRALLSQHATNSGCLHTALPLPQTAA